MSICSICSVYSIFNALVLQLQKYSPKHACNLPVARLLFLPASGLKNSALLGHDLFATKPKKALIADTFINVL